ncbi:MAG: hypothetical protein U0H96_05565 [Christensenellales bacterium]|nr:hypothetical protein [Christensenellales bacterium]
MARYLYQPAVTKPFVQRAAATKRGRIRRSNIVVLWIVRLLALPVIVLLYVAGFVLNLLYGICGSIGMILAGLGGFPRAAGWQLCTGGSFGACGVAVMPICSTDAAITGGKCLDCRCISVICLAILKTEYDDEPLSAAQRFFFFRQHSRSHKVGIVMEEVMRLE